MEQKIKVLPTCLYAKEKIISFQYIW